MAYYREVLSASIVALATTLSACGGGGGSSGGGGGSTFIPRPPTIPTPTETGAIVLAATTSQEFVTKGASYTSPASSDGHLVVSNPELADNAQLNLRYDAQSKTYEIELSNSDDWRALMFDQAGWWNDGTEGYSTGEPNRVYFVIQRNLSHSAVLAWSSDTASGFSAVATATPSGGVPITGSALYNGSIFGASSESTPNPWDYSGANYAGIITGNISLDFNFGSGTLSGNISPVVLLNGGEHTLATLGFSDTVHSVGSTTFSGKFVTALPGQNSFSGLFAGPLAQELIGNFAFPYVSPISGGNEQAAGAFAARVRPMLEP